VPSTSVASGERGRDIERMRTMERKKRLLEEIMKEKEKKKRKEENKVKGKGEKGERKMKYIIYF
jgi:hypothetical protein